MELAAEETTMAEAAVNKMSYNIRKAVKKDCKAIYKFLSDMVEYEQVQDSFTQTYEDVEREGFGENPMFHGLVVECQQGSAEEKSVVGCCLYYPSYSTLGGRLMYLEIIYVDSAHRGSKLASTLIRQLSKIAMEDNCREIKFVVLPWNKHAYDVYKYMGADDEAIKWRSMAWHYDALQKMSLISPPGNVNIDL
ncbi:thialysine N-epsilon-acetyltransferase-like isoform X2 [Tubulanus polymorphus]|uniref:thialysine N-epsilon-acetyltransferase-like isoform X2 n=1 Tax=Tubulanus polymorphus TaxID=672921 RepID=UPI003DA22093